MLLWCVLRKGKQPPAWMGKHAWYSRICVFVCSARKLAVCVILKFLRKILNFTDIDLRYGAREDVFSYAREHTLTSGISREELADVIWIPSQFLSRN